MCSVQEGVEDASFLLMFKHGGLRQSYKVRRYDLWVTNSSGEDCIMFSMSRREQGTSA